MKAPFVHRLLRLTATLSLLAGSTGFVACAPGFAPAPGLGAKGGSFTVDKREDSDSPQFFYDEPVVLLPSHLNPAAPSQPDTPPLRPTDPKAGTPGGTPSAPSPEVPITWPDETDDEPTPVTPQAPPPVKAPLPQPAAPEPAAPSNPNAPSAPTVPAPSGPVLPSPDSPVTPEPSVPPAQAPSAPPSKTPETGTDDTPLPTPPPAHAPPATPDVRPTPGPQQPRPTRAVVACEKMDSASCPEAVGLLFIRTANWMGQCTVSLIGDQIAITNSHCIPDEIKADGADCSQTLQLYFPQTPTAQPEKVFCEKILKVSTIAKEGDKKFALEPDFAVLRLARKMNRKSFQVKRDGLQDGMKLAAYTIDPQTTGSLRGVLKVKFCTARQGSVSAPSFVQDFAPVGSFDGCEIIPGNSGSAAIDREGYVRALVHATLPPQVMPVPKGGASAPAHLFNRMAMLTNIACTTIPAEAAANAGAPNPACVKNLSSDDVIRFAYANSDDKQIEPIAKEWLKTAPKQFEFELRRSERQSSSIHLLAPQIKCVKDPKLWSAGDSASPVVLKASLPFFGFVLDLDEDYRVRLTPGIVDQMELSFEFDPSALAGGAVTSRATITSRNTQQSQVKDFPLVRCR